MWADAEDFLDWFLRKTLFFWLGPYIFWFFFRRVTLFVVDFLTVPPGGTPRSRDSTLEY